MYSTNRAEYVMEYKNTIRALNKLGASVVTDGRRILRNFKPYAATTSSNTLYNDFDYVVTSNNEMIALKWEFGGAESYWQFVDEGVRGAQPQKHKGRPRAIGSPFKYSNKMPPRGAIDRWIVNKPLKAAREKGKFISRKSLAFAIQRSIFEKGVHRTQFFSRPFEQDLEKQSDNIGKAFADDLEVQLEIMINT